MFVGTASAEHLVRKLCISLRAHGRKVQNHITTARWERYMGEQYQQSKQSHSRLSTPSQRFVQYRGQQSSQPRHSLSAQTSFRLNLRSPKAFRTWRVNSSTPNARELTDDGGGQMGAAPLDPGERSVNSGVLVAAVAGLGDPEPLPKSAGT